MAMPWSAFQVTRLPVQRLARMAGIELSGAEELPAAAFQILAEGGRSEFEGGGDFGDGPTFSSSIGPRLTRPGWRSRWRDTFSAGRAGLRVS